MATTFVKEFMGTNVMAATKATVTSRAVFSTEARKTNTKKVVKKVVRKAGTKKVVAKKTARRGPQSNFGPDRPLWYPGQPPEWLDGSMIGDRGFDPLGLSKPSEFVQIDLDGLDQNSAKNPAGDVIGRFVTGKTEVSEDSLQPYSEVFDINRFRECELIHGRWCMVASLGALVGEAATGVSWVDAGKVQLEGCQYLGVPISFSIGQLVFVEALLMGYIEVARNTELDSEKRCYPGGKFDPFNLATPEDIDNLKLAEIKHSRLAMVAFFIFGAEALFGDNTSPLEAIGF